MEYHRRLRYVLQQFNSCLFKLHCCIFSVPTLLTYRCYFELFGIVWNLPYVSIGVCCFTFSFVHSAGSFSTPSLFVVDTDGTSINNK